MVRFLVVCTHISAMYAMAKICESLFLGFKTPEKRFKTEITLTLDL